MVPALERWVVALAPAQSCTEHVDPLDLPFTLNKIPLGII